MNTVSAIERLRSSFPDPADLRAELAKLKPEELYRLAYDWNLWARPAQMLPPGNWATWLILAGRGFGKTRTGAETVRIWHNQGRRFINFIARTAEDLRTVMVEGESGILAVCPPGERPNYQPSKARLVWPNGAITLLFSAEEPDRLRGPQHDGLWCFVAGTMVSTPLGDRPIESIQQGDIVCTRHGDRRVNGTGSREAIVGTVTFSNGAKLTGSQDHPVFTFDGWTTLQNLSIGQSIALATSSRTSVRSRKMVSAPLFISTAGFGRRLTVRSQRKCKSIIATKTNRTTISQTFNSSHISSIAPSTPSKGEVNLTRHASATRAAVCDAALLSRSRASREPKRNAAFVRIEPLMKPELRRASVKTAGGSSGRFVAITAASVASTWEPAGRETVFNLSVEREHEYIANGVVVHNCDEPAAWQYADETWDQAQFGLRLGPNPQVVATTTPRPTALIRKLIEDPNTILTRGTSYENRGNLSERFYSAIIKKYEGTRLGRQELNAEVLDDNPGALWRLADIEASRIQRRRDYRRVVVAIDPATTSDPDSDETGIVVCGLVESDPIHFDVLEDASGIFAPDAWAKRAVELYWQWEADRVIGEANNGGDMIEAVLRHQDQNVSYRKVTATRGKAIRAEPISALYEQRRVHHVGTFAKLEDQLINWDPATAEKSPDRLDALVWALTELSSESSGGFAGYYAKRKAAMQGGAKR